MALSVAVLLMPAAAVFWPGRARRLTASVASMSSPLALVVLLAVAGCAPVTRSFYLPLDRSQAHEGTTCGSVPYGGWSRKFGSKASLSIDITPAADALWVGMQVVLDAGVELRFLGPEIRVEPDGMPPVTMAISEESGKPYPSVDPGSPLVGRTYRSPIPVNVKFPAMRPGRLALQLPVIRVDGQDTEIPKLQFELVERHGVMACVQ